MNIVCFFLGHRERTATKGTMKTKQGLLREVYQCDRCERLVMK